MRAVSFSSFGDLDVLEIADVPTTEPGVGQVRIAVRASTVNPADAYTRSGALAAYLPDRPSYGLGWDAAGTVDALGEGVTGFAVGDRVVAMSDYFDTLVPTQADFVVLDAAAVAPAPAGLDFAGAATVPLNALTAAQALDLIGLTKGQTLAITGAAGAVGGFAAQLAGQAGLTVYGIAGEQDADFLREIGAILVPRSDDPAAALRAVVPAGVDGLLDAALLGVPAMGGVRDGGVFVSVARPTPAGERGIRTDSVMVHSDGTRLAALVGLVEQGKLAIRVAETLPLTEVAAAQALVAKGGIRGRVVLVP
ncbi:MAG TPA: NADP-dependent oxidoreductase [Pseudonocardiaceae bacterium]|nr:NADP-dependent oxidoreductase [Pseudonocardiaceae bacterium]